MNAVWIAAATIGGLVLLAAGLGFLIGRYGERGKIADWLWDQSGSPLVGRLVDGIERGDHRRSEK